MAAFAAVNRKVFAAAKVFFIKILDIEAASGFIIIIYEKEVSIC